MAPARALDGGLGGGGGGGAARLNSQTFAPASAPATIAESINHYTHRVQLSAEEWARRERGAGPSGSQ